MAHYQSEWSSEPLDGLQDSGGQRNGQSFAGRISMAGKVWKSDRLAGLNEPLADVHEIRTPSLPPMHKQRIAPRSPAMDSHLNLVTVGPVAGRLDLQCHRFCVQQFLKLLIYRRSLDPEQLVSKPCSSVFGVARFFLLHGKTFPLLIDVWNCVAVVFAWLNGVEPRSRKPGGQADLRMPSAVKALSAAPRAMSCQLI